MTTGQKVILDSGLVSKWQSGDCVQANRHVEWDTACT